MYIYPAMAKKLFLLLLLAPFLTLAQHTLTGNFTPKEAFNWAILYEIQGTKVQYAKDGRITDGVYTIPLDSTVSKGMYRIVYGLPQELKNFDFMYNGQEDVKFTFSEEKGISFTHSVENKKWQGYQSEMLKIQAKIDTVLKGNAEGHEKIAPLLEWQKETQISYERATDSLMIGSFISASKPYIPASFKDKAAYITGQRNNYFTHVDVTDSTLQNSTFILQKTLGFIKKKEDTDIVASFLKPAPLTYQRFILLQAWETAVSNEQSALANYLSQHHLTPLAKTLEDQALVDRLSLYENLSLGAKAPDFTWEYQENEKLIVQTLHEYNAANYYVVVFWSSSCSHCLGELPKLQKFVNHLPKDEYKVIAIGLEDNKYEWKNETYRYPEFQHVLGLGKWENEIGNRYDVSKTPTYFVLDKDKKIVLKPEGLEQLMEKVVVKTAEK